MKETEILSTLQVPTQFAPLEDGHDVVAKPRVNSALPVFDACHVGVVLRAVLFVQASLGAVTLLMADSALDWLLRVSMLTAVALPAVLAWLILGCAAQGWLARMPMRAQAAVGVVLGALAGVFAAGLLKWLGLMPQARWLGAALAGALLAGVVVAGLVWRARAQVPADTHARLAELQSRIRPHFLFNTLNSAIALVRADPARAEELLEDLSELFRHMLHENGQSVSLAQELELAQRYLAIEEVRFGSRLRLTWALDPDADDARLPPLVLQPLVENAVKHGVEPSPGGADIHISTQRRGDVVIIKVTNTVPAGSGEPGNGLALANVRERLSLMHDLKAQFRCGKADGVFQVRMEVPA